MGLNQAQRAANYRARKKGKPEPYGEDFKAIQQAQNVEKEEFLRVHNENLEWAKQQDASGRFYKSECRSVESLLAIYEGQKPNTLIDEEEEEKGPKKTQKLPNPSIQPIRLRAIETVVDGEVVKIDPDSYQHRHLLEIDGVLTFQEWLDYRDKGRHSLFWLSNLVGKQLFHNSHQMICDMFVQKDGFSYFPGYDRHDVSAMIKAHKRVAAEGTPTRTAMIFAPRGGWKSTIDGIDAVQWMLVAPDIRIMMITAFRQLSKQFLKEIKGYFYLPPEGEPTAFHLLYPEYVLTGVAGRSREPISCPAAVLAAKEPHLWISSMESSITGQRCDIAKLDDVVDPKNSNDEILRQGLAEKVNGALDLVEPWGFVDIIGTRYFTDDYYGTRMQPDEDGIVAPYTLLSISAWYPKPEFEVKYHQLLEEPNGMSKVTEDMVNLWFPFKLDYATLRRKLLEKKERNSTNIQKERSFRNQQLNIATDPMEVTEFVVHFDREVLRTHTYASTAAPEGGEEIVTVDWSYTDGKTSDYTVFAAIRRHVRPDGTQELIVREIEYAKLKSSDIASRLVLFLRKHKPNRTFIEKANGWDLLWYAIDGNAKKWGCEDILQSVRWVDIDNSPKAKANRVKTLELLLADDRLHFVSGHWIDETHRQFERFTGETKMGRKDDIPDAISLASRTLPISMFVSIKSASPEEDKEAQEKAEKQRAKAFHYQRMFGTQFSGTIKNPAHPNPQAPKLSQWRQGYRTDTPPQPVQPIESEPQKPKDPRMVIFGNKGPWRL